MEHRFQFGSMELRILQGDITDQDTDAIVNAANERLQHGAGVAGAIVRKGGRIIQEESNRVAPVKTGDAAVTSGGSLRARYVIHAVGPIWNRYEPEEADRLMASAVRQSLARAEELGLSSLSFPAISTGIFGFPIDRCARIVLGTILEHATTEPRSLSEVRVVLFDANAYEAFCRTASDIAAALDARKLR